MERRYRLLSQFLGSYLHQNWPDFYETPDQAVETAIEECPTELRQQLRRELASLLAETPDDKQLRDVLNWGLGVGVYFRRPEEARAFAESVEEKLMTSIKREFDR